MNPSDAQEGIAGKRIGTLGDLRSGRVAVYCCVMATGARLAKSLGCGGGGIMGHVDFTGEV